MRVMYNALKESDAWDQRYNLPLFPKMNNPWIYFAYAQLCLERWPIGGVTIHEPFIVEHFAKCEIEPGLFTRWPDKQGWFTSHDEIMGACFLSDRVAHRVLTYLEEHDGEFNWEGIKSLEGFNVFRFPWLEPYLRQCAGWRVSLFSQLIWSAFIVWDALTRTPNLADAGGALRNWLMVEKMKTLPIAGIAAYFWKWRVQKKYTPAECLAREPGEPLGEFGPRVW
jgi:hypothetical protein